jgi:hypothetical protein
MRESLACLLTFAPAACKEGKRGFAAARGDPVFVTPADRRRERCQASQQS